MDKFVEIWDQLALNQRPGPVDRNRRHENPSDVELSCAGGHTLSARLTSYASRTSGIKAYTEPATPSCVVGSLLRTKFEL